MNAVKKLAIVLSLGVLAGSAFAATSEKAYVSAYKDAPGSKPVPVKVVAPKITTTPGAEVVLEFTVNKAGVPKAITVASSNDEALAAAAVAAVAEWRFTPAMKDGETVETKVKLPVRAELPTFNNGRYAFVY
ncbi:TonB family protein [Synoicihabitans lomoniglobus]|uniref:TonB family protein n=1 Tax=Synoicihabitans lomoniglobus TaxID=2909285 RepID=A0AAE9ZZ41_9BACT|nr:energy transducer TonB [Opitutaceae bacterium LMO-M01]WED63943.1 TonB family protein [Opitutaceae bacterium LMO-M01]